MAFIKVRFAKHSYCGTPSSSESLSSDSVSKIMAASENFTPFIPLSGAGVGEGAESCFEASCKKTKNTAEAKLPMVEWTKSKHQKLHHFNVYSASEACNESIIFKAASFRSSNTREPCPVHVLQKMEENHPSFLLHTILLLHPPKQRQTAPPQRWSLLKIFFFFMDEFSHKFTVFLIIISVI